MNSCICELTSKIDQIYLCLKGTYRLPLTLSRRGEKKTKKRDATRWICPYTAAASWRGVIEDACTAATRPRSTAPPQVMGHGLA